MPKQSLSIPEQSLSYPEHAPSQPVNCNIELVLASYVPWLQFLYRTLPGNPFLPLTRVPTGADFGSTCQRARD